VCLSPLQNSDDVFVALAISDHVFVVDVNQTYAKVVSPDPTAPGLVHTSYE
jgi:hypothetical protein